MQHTLLTGYQNKRGGKEREGEERGEQENGVGGRGGEEKEEGKELKGQEELRNE